jgi:hypothetical protein
MHRSIAFVVLPDLSESRNRAQAAISRGWDIPAVVADILEIASAMLGSLGRRASDPVLLPENPFVAYDRGMENVTLTPELEWFATEAVSTGRYRDVSAVGAISLPCRPQSIFPGPPALLRARSTGSRY